jgi:hypothetical protein
MKPNWRILTFLLVVAPIAIWFAVLVALLAGSALPGAKQEGHADFLARVWSITGAICAAVFVLFLVVSVGRLDIGWYKGNRIDAAVAVALVFVVGGTIWAALDAECSRVHEAVVRQALVDLRSDTAHDRWMAATSLALSGKAAIAALPALEDAVAKETDPEVKAKMRDAISRIRADAGQSRGNPEPDGGAANGD